MRKNRSTFDQHVLLSQSSKPTNNLLIRASCVLYCFGQKGKNKTSEPKPRPVLRKELPKD